MGDELVHLIDVLNREGEPRKTLLYSLNSCSTVFKMDF